MANSKIPQTEYIHFKHYTVQNNKTDAVFTIDTSELASKRVVFVSPFAMIGDQADGQCVVATGNAKQSITITKPSASYGSSSATLKVIIGYFG